MDDKKFKRLMKQVERKDFKDNEKFTTKAEELRRLLQNACSQLVEIHEYTKRDFRFMYDDVHYTVTMDKPVFGRIPDKIHIHRCLDGKFITRDIVINEVTDDASKNLELMNEVITNWFKAKGVR